MKDDIPTCFCPFSGIRAILLLATLTNAEPNESSFLLGKLSQSHNVMITNIFDTSSNNNINLNNEQDEDFSCDVLNDRCSLQDNGECDNTNAAANCIDGDCFDCDQCRQFDYNCNRCLQQTGCHWCPGDALCYNSPNYGLGACPSVEDFVTDSCSVAGQDNFFDDPLYSAQRWVFDMIHVDQVWAKGYFGNGIRVRINDNGVDASHPEFGDRFDREASCEIIEPPQEEIDYDPEGAGHGTSVAAIVGGGANNSVCSVGVAPQVSLSACYAFAGDDILVEKLNAFDISQNSYGIDGCTSRFARNLMPTSCPFTQPNAPCGACDFANYPLSTTCESSIIAYCYYYYENDEAGCVEFLDLFVAGGTCEFDTLTETQRLALTAGIREGRDGKGVIFVFAAGNAYAFGDDTNFQSYTNSRLVISVGAVGKDGRHASYSTPGASVFVTGPGGDFETESGHVTAGLDGACVDASVGTSNSCPVVSGVIALMLEANTELSWRDVQGIIATTSQAVEDDPDDATDQLNGAGIWHSNYYGFGIIDAAAAVEAAETWELFGPERMLVGESGIVNLPISEFGGATRSAVTIAAQGNDTFATESVNVYLDMQHFSRGHLEVVLTSPEGTKSILSPGQRPESTLLASDRRWKLLTVRHWGESPVGNWTLEVIDLKDGDATECASAGWYLPSEPDIDCQVIAFQEWCVDGLLDPNSTLSEGAYALLFETVNDGLTAPEACCECGGGLTSEEVVDQLRQWRIVLYGRDLSLNQGSAPPTAEGGIDGIGDGIEDGDTDGALDGGIDGTSDGDLDGVGDGFHDGESGGDAEGQIDGGIDGAIDGGFQDGETDAGIGGESDGIMDGDIDGIGDGLQDGDAGEPIDGGIDGAMDGVSDGNVDGVTDGFQDGDVDGGIGGESDGDVDGAIEGVSDGNMDGGAGGPIDGSIDGITDGDIDGVTDGFQDGDVDGGTGGESDGAFDGIMDGVLDGGSGGPNDGSIDGVTDGSIDGVQDGFQDGDVDGDTGGESDGAIDGFLDGDIDGGAGGPIDGSMDGVTDGDIDGVTDGFQDGDVDGGTGGESDGAVDGLVDGDETGGNDGPIDGTGDGISNGNIDGVSDGFQDGEVDGDTSGGIDGIDDGFLDGSIDGVTDGFQDGESDGGSDGESDGTVDDGSDGGIDGATDGFQDGGIDGDSEGESESDGTIDGAPNGDIDGMRDGVQDGELDSGSGGASDGAEDGDVDGVADGVEDGNIDGVIVSPVSASPTMSLSLALPSAAPSLFATSKSPTDTPSVAPVSTPTTFSPVTRAPTATPTLPPVNPPTMPPVSAPPTEAPSSVPSKAPVVKPTWAPTSPTTQFPTGLIPSSSPTIARTFDEVSSKQTIRGATSNAAPRGLFSVITICFSSWAISLFFTF